MVINKPFLGAVLTGDIVNSTQLTLKQEKELNAKLVRVLGLFFGDHQYEFFRGDSFQVLVKDVTRALRLALACRSVAMSIDANQQPAVRLFDIRISIGIGEVNMPVKSLSLAKGEAFILSGRQFDLLKERGQRLAIDSFDPIASIGFQAMADYLDSIYRDMTPKQADVIIELLQGITQQQLAISREKSKSTISELASAGRWQEIEKILDQYETLVNLIL
jgi:hypothetical protein